MDNYYQAPMLQGEENDYGDYDYLITEIPNNEEKWNWFNQKCDYCGKYHNYCKTSTQFFRTYDGYDNYSENECIFCYVKNLIRHKFNKIKQKIKKRKERNDLYYNTISSMGKINSSTKKLIKKTIKEAIK